jgi:S-adenosyl-L-methionine hydrolase (adenosine-forming)
MAMRYDTISFLSDYGHADEFVGVVHSVLRQLCPEARVIDITHEVPPFDVRAGGLTLARSVQYLTPGVVMAIVDPGVGSSRRPVAVEVGHGSAVLVGPDNGVLAPAVAMVGGATRAVWLNDPEHHLEAPGPLFDGRDVFAPVAAKLCSGEVAFEDLGELIDPVSLLPGVFPLSELTDGAMSAEVLWIDRYGNAQLNVEPTELDAMGDVFELRTDRGTRTARRVHHFSELGIGTIGLAVDSYGFIAVVADRASAAEELSLGAGDPVTLVAIDDEGPSAAVTTPVQLSSHSGRGRGE